MANSKEIWKPISFGNYNKYNVSNTGKIKNIKSGKILKGLPLEYGYLTVCLYSDIKDEKAKKFLIHVLVALVFVPNPDNKPTVDHINRITNDNNATNLRWADHKEQNQNRKKAIYKHFPIYQCDKSKNIIKKWDSTKEICEKLNINKNTLKGAIKFERILDNFYWIRCNDSRYFLNEIWKEIPYTFRICKKIKDNDKGKFASNYGRIKNENGDILAGRQTKYNTIKIYDIHTNKRSSIALHILVAAAFHGLPKDEKLIVNHIDLDTNNNNPYNLEWITRKENTIHAIKNGAIDYTKKYKKVKQIDKNGNIINEFNSVKEAEQKTGVKNISAVARGARPFAGNCKWEYF